VENAGKHAVYRLKRVLLNDKTLPTGLPGLLRSDLTKVIASYFDFDERELEIDIDLDASGKYHIKIFAPAERVKNVKIL